MKLIGFQHVKLRKKYDMTKFKLLKMNELAKFFLVGRAKMKPLSNLIKQQIQLVLRTSSAIVPIGKWCPRYSTSMLESIHNSWCVFPASPTCKGCKSDLQILQVGLADILNRICRKIKPRFTLAKRGVGKIKCRFTFNETAFYLLIKYATRLCCSDDV